MSNRESSRIPDFKPQVPADLIGGLDEKDKYLFERIDIITQSMNWQGDKLYDIQATVDCIDEDTKELKKFRSEMEQSSSVQSAVDKEKINTKGRLKKYIFPFSAFFLGILYPAYLEAYSELGGKLIIRSLIETIIP